MRLVERLGIATCLLGVFITGAYQLAGWLGPRADKLIDKHIEIVDKVASIEEQNSRTLQAVGYAVEQISETQEKQAETLSEIQRAIVPGRVGVK